MEELIGKIIELYEEENDERRYNEKNILNFTDNICILEQHLNDDKYKLFIEDVSSNDYYVCFEYTYDGSYDYDKINIVFEDDRDYIYDMEFGDVPDYSGYCECIEGDKGYDNRYKCCGYGCDWDIPTFTVTKIQTIGYSKFKGFQRDLWEYNDKFYNITKKEKERQERMIAIDDLKRQKEEIESRLKELEVEYGI